MSTIRDVAKASGVSATTVSFVLNNSPRPVNVETRRRVLEVARRMNYHPNAMARGLVQRRIYTIGVLLPSIEPSIVTNHYASGILSGVFSESAARGYDIHLHTHKWESAEVSAPRFRDRRTDGTLIVVPPMESDLVSGLYALNIPIVVISSPTAVPGVPYVDVNNVVGTRLATEHLLSLGHTRIAHLMGTLLQHSVLERRDAFLRTLQRAGVSVPDRYVVGSSFAVDKAYQAIRELLALPVPPTALFATNDDLAMTAIRAAQDSGLSVPEQFSVVGFDNYPNAAQITPPLTTIHHPLWEIGKAATNLLIQQVEESESEEGAHLFEPELVVRGSTARPMLS